jgi:hypothetical protein
MKTLVWAGFALVIGVGTGWTIAAVERNESGEHFVSNSAQNPRLRTDITSESTSEITKGYPHVEVVNGASFDFGEVSRGAKGSHVFVVQNRGDKTLELRMGETTCKCTFVTEGILDKTGQKPTLVEPGETLEVELQWRAEEMLIKFDQSAMLHTNDPDHLIIRLHISGIVNQAMRIVPETIVWSNLASTEGRSAEAILFCGLPLDEWEILDLQLNSPASADFFEVDVEDASPEKLAELTPNENYGKQIRSGRLVKIRVKPGLPIGPLYQSITVKTSVEDVSEIIIQIEGHVIADISVIGRGFDPRKNLLRLPTVESQNGLEAWTLQLLIKGDHRNTTEFKIAEIEPAEALTVELGKKTSTEKLTRIPLIVRIPPGTRPIARLGTKGEYGKIRLTTNHPQVKELTLYVRFVVK